MVADSASSFYDTKINNFYRQQIKFGRIVKCLPEIAQLFTILQVNPKITIHWIPGHSGIPGNDIVDLVAKWSAASPVSHQPKLQNRTFKMWYNKSPRNGS